MLFVFIRNGVRSLVRTSLVLGGLFCAGLVLAQDTPTPSPTPQPGVPPVNESVVVSATRSPETELEIPGEATVITGEQLRAQGVTNLADGIQNVMGMDTGMGSDNGPRQPNVGMWGLKEFDALLFMVDGVPVGGPFNPSLAQIDIGDIDHIEIVKGPQGTLYGVSAFAGMVQVFTKSGTAGSTISIAGGSFNEGRINGSTTIPIGKSSLQLYGDFDRLTNGWQPNTDYQDARGGFRLNTPIEGGGTFSLSYNMFLNTQFWGSPLPVDPPTGEVIPGFKPDSNYAPVGARLDHRVYAVTANVTLPINKATSVQNTLGFSRDNQISVRSFVSGVDENTNIGTSAGVSLKPVQTYVYDDLHLVTNFQAAGAHQLVGGAAVTWGKETAVGYGFDFNFQIDPVIVPNLSDIPAGDHRSFRDERTFVGLYLNDQWTPVPFLTITAGARYDITSETLHAQAQEVGDPNIDVSDDSQHADQWSGGGSILGRIFTNQPGALNNLNVYFAGKTNFKPAAPNLQEAETAVILSPERTTSEEVGVKSVWWNDQIDFDVSFFHMIFKNLVVSILGPDGNPRLVNAGQELFQGAEFSVNYHPNFLPYFSFMAGYAHHDALYQVFTFIDPDEGAAGRLRRAPRADAARPLERNDQLRPGQRPRRMVRHPSPEPPPLRQDQPRIHAVVLRVRPRRLLHVRPVARGRRRPEHRRQPPLRG